MGSGHMGYLCWELRRVDWEAWVGAHGALLRWVVCTGVVIVGLERKGVIGGGAEAGRAHWLV